MPWAPKSHRPNTAFRQADHEDRRPSARARGYDSAWQKARATYLAKHPLCVEHAKVGWVVAATVVGMPDAYRGESPAAFVELRPGSTATVEALLAMLAESLSPITMPKLIEIRPHLPRTAVGKLSKTELRAELKARQAVPDPHHAGAAP
jgi:acyl-CoA synthetase (AMP-forming)/AMP-acid ligase II